MNQIKMTNWRIIVLFSALFFVINHNVYPGNKKDSIHFAQDELRVLTYNIHHANPPSREGIIDLDAIARVINQQKPDLVALQEVDVGTLRAGGIDEAAILSRKTGLNVCFGKAIDYQGGEYGVAMLSRYPLSTPSVYHLPNDSLLKAEPRILLVANLTLPGKRTLCFGVTHLDVKSEINRIAQAREINRIVKEWNKPFLLAGDFNAIPGSTPVHIIEEQFVRTCQQCEYTIPVNTPSYTIDQIFISRDTPLRPVSTDVISETYASDHLPVSSVLRWTDKRDALEEAPVVKAARGVIRRQIGVKAENIRMEKIDACEGKDVFEIEAGNGILIIRANSTIAFCYGFNRYMKNACHSMVTWSGKHLSISDSWPDYPKEKIISPYSKSLVGFGFAPEGIENNEMVYELLADMGWTTRKINVNNWFTTYCIYRYGGCPGQMKKAGDGLLHSCYGSFSSYPRFVWQLVKPGNKRQGSVNSDPQFLEAVENFLDCSNELKQSELYRNDAIEMAALYLGIKADIYYRQALEYRLANKTQEMKEAGEKTIRLLQAVDKLLASHPLCRLDQWISKARMCGSSIVEQDYYESDAKRIITTWGGAQNDYAARAWSGLIRDYYIPRLKMFLDGKENDIASWEKHWINTPGVSVIEPFEDPVSSAKELVAQYKEE